MKYLLDTHTALWIFGNKEKLSKKAKSIADDTSAALCVSVASVWEIAIKVSIGKSNFDGGVNLFLEKIRKNGIELISVEASHVKGVEVLPFIHRDPFDRMLIATAKAEGLTILTADENIRKYDVPAVW